MDYEKMCMDIRGFAEKVCKAVSQELGEKYQVKLQEVTKNNGVILQGLVILSEEMNVSPTIYLNSFMEAYEAGVSLSVLVEHILEIYREDTPRENVDMSFFREFDRVKDRICYRLINREKNRVLIERIPHVDFLDLCICFYYAYQDEVLGTGSILIYNNHMEMWGSSVEELAGLAGINTPRLFPWEAHSMGEVLREMLYSEDGKDEKSIRKNRGKEENDREKCKQKDAEWMLSEDGMQILSNTQRVQGAVCMIYPQVLDQLAVKMGGDLYILPSSIHEVILLRTDKAEDEAMLREMVREVNATQVEPEEILSDNLYFYHSETSEISLI